MKKSYPLSTALAVLFLTFFVSCKKNEICLKCIPPGMTSTKILRYYGDWYTDSLTLMGTITYNKLGDPVSILKSPHPVEGNVDCIFWYDKKGRLSDYIGVYTDHENYEFWYHYYYDKSDRIAVDSIYIFGSMKNNKPNKMAERGTAYQYDDMGRIVKATERDWDGQHAWDQTFEYDERGNLKPYYTTQYDNNYNPLLLHKVWQFIARDYSVNNRVSQIRPIQYNNKKFPVYYQADDEWSSFLAQPVGEYIRIDYSN